MRTIQTFFCLLMLLCVFLLSNAQSIQWTNTGEKVKTDKTTATDNGKELTLVSYKEQDGSKFYFLRFNGLRGYYIFYVFDNKLRLLETKKLGKDLAGYSIRETRIVNNRIILLGYRLEKIAFLEFHPASATTEVLDETVFKTPWGVVTNFLTNQDNPSFWIYYDSHLVKNTHLSEANWVTQKILTYEYEMHIDAKSNEYRATGVAKIDEGKYVVTFTKSDAGLKIKENAQKDIGITCYLNSGQGNSILPKSDEMLTPIGVAYIKGFLVLHYAAISRDMLDIDKIVVHIYESRDPENLGNPIIRDFFTQPFFSSTSPGKWFEEQFYVQAFSFGDGLLFNFTHIHNSSSTSVSYGNSMSWANTLGYSYYSRTLAYFDGTIYVRSEVDIDLPSVSGKTYSISPISIWGQLDSLKGLPENSGLKSNKPYSRWNFPGMYYNDYVNIGIGYSIPLIKQPFRKIWNTQYEFVPPYNTTSLEISVLLDPKDTLLKSSVSKRLVYSEGAKKDKKVDIEPYSIIAVPEDKQYIMLGELKGELYIGKVSW